MSRAEKKQCAKEQHVKVVGIVVSVVVTIAWISFTVACYILR